MHVLPLFSKIIIESWMLRPQMGGKDLPNHHQMSPTSAAVTNGPSPSPKSLAGVTGFILHYYKRWNGSPKGKATPLHKASLCSSRAPRHSQALSK